MPDILILGATGVTGRQAAKYLNTHPQKGSFTWAIAGRTKSKLDKLVKELSLPDDLSVLVVDTLKYSDIEKAVKDFKVVINLVGPYFKWGGSLVVKACVLHGVHYVDITGESWWIRDIITEYDYSATKSGAIIVPSCGFDSVPADMCVYLARKTLSEELDSYVGMASSITAYKVKGGVSGGTADTAISFATDLPKHKQEEARRDFVLSPIVGAATPKPQLVYKLPVPGTQNTITGSVFPMVESNRAIVQRSWGLFEHRAVAENIAKAHRTRYGPKFTYEEIVVLPGAATAAVVSTVVMFFRFLLFSVPFGPWLLKKFVPKPGEGPNEHQMINGSFTCTNITTTTPSDSYPNPLKVKTTIVGSGDPGYYLTPHMAAEGALALLLEKDSLPHNASKGGILTPMFAFGEVLVERLRKTGRFNIESQLVDDAKKTK